MMMKIPLLDLKSQYAVIKDEIMLAVEEVLEAQYFILGPKVMKIEEEIAHYCNARYAIGLSSGTDALLASLMAINIEPGDAIITTPYSFFATVEVIIRLGATPIFVDIDPLTYNLSTDKLKELFEKGEKKPRAIIPVHLYGQCAEMNDIMTLAREQKIKVIEDAAQAIGAKYRENFAGAIGDMGCFSFFPSKNLGGYGDGGMVITNSPDLAKKLKSLRVHGVGDAHHYHMIGGNFRLDALQAAVLSVKLKYLDNWTEKRRHNANTYNSLFKEYGLCSIQTPHSLPENFHVYNQYVIRASNRDKLQESLKAEGVNTAVYYPIPLHLQPCFSCLGYKKGDFPEAEKASRETLALPIYPELTLKQQEYIVRKIAMIKERRL
ncbi:MAG: UDP-2-acetamido-2-deoxy-3-oxo-D-glucuronate aminotransferase [Syntrophomonadaceae bacterium]|nr:UDP-2-acetamido-2-deoxy-3-oxo-D-glucuronate aminotransferase [Bacillota bacterium]